MEGKKNPSKDLSLQRNKFFLIGLSVSIGLAITAFEWRTVKVKREIVDCDFGERPIEFIVPATTIEPPAAQPMKKLEPPKIATINAGEIIAVTNNTAVDNLPPIIFESDSTSSISTGTLDPEPEDSPIFIFVENNPEPLNGFKSFYQQLGKNIKYPPQAKRIGTEGKVFVEFIVNKNGEPSDLKIIRGIGSGCDEEALRVLSLTKWEPGKQRGKPVRVKMAMQLNFKLN
ncbi:MAG: energy transducer TonB [Cyclobacteriaceae bacterium]